MKSLILAAGLSLLAFASSAAASQTVDAKDPEAIVNILKGFGTATLDKDDTGDPMIKGRVDGTIYLVYFMSCTEHKDCQSITYSSSWDVNGIEPKVIAAWNANWRFAKAYLDPSKQPVVRMDVNLHGGVSEENFTDTFDWWQTMLGKFKKDVVAPGA